MLTPFWDAAVAKSAVIYQHRDNTIFIYFARILALLMTKFLFTPLPGSLNNTHFSLASLFSVVFWQTFHNLGRIFVRKRDSPEGAWVPVRNA